ncbi:OLC1v1007518C1 [Oldenlandia corymbosa var. corymbosa]|uniref:OLC1v1007518C1 n=1 Tax=Oldenlandia corymbosa var. corymbosa TaxID=529605 RepID=A0AAV1DJF5_OLDCO|nr:OLC1v1007518C1 [Oldenlandia corymbosa var. corymbosa]
MEGSLSVINPQKRSLRDWRDLPPELLDVIVSKVFYVFDYIQIGAVCKSWRSVALNQKPKRMSTIQQQPPLLLIENSKSQTNYKLYNVGEERFYNTPQLKVPPLSPSRRLCGSSYGWLATHKQNGSVKLINPFTGKIIKVGFGGNDFVNNNSACNFEKLILSCKPVEGDDDLFIAGLLAIVNEKKETYHCVVFKRATETSSSSSWRVAVKVDFRFKFQDIIFHKGSLYALDYSDRISAFDYYKGSYDVEILLPPYRIPPGGCYNFLVEASNGDLLVLSMGEPNCPCKKKGGGYTWIQVSKLMKDAKRGRLGFVEISELNDNDSIFFCSTFPYGFQHSSCVPGFNKNSIYFTQRCMDGLGTFHTLVFRTDDQTIRPVWEDHSWDHLWITPTLC